MSDTKTYVIDNGGEYSDHRLYFVETHWPVEVIEQCIAIKSNEYEKAYLVAALGSVEWLGTANRMTLAEYLAHPFVSVDVDELPAEAKKLPRDLLEATARAAGVPLESRSDTDDA
jgi:hypothetical protein